MRPMQRDSLFGNLARLGMITALWVTGLGAASAADSLDWDTARGRVTADIQTWTLPTLLERVAERTGWEVFVEPDTSAPVSAKFSDQPSGEALRRLLGKLNFALLPQTNAPARLFIYRTTLQEATQRVRIPPKRMSRTGQPIANELVVVLEDGADAEALAKRVGAKIVGGIEGIDTYRLQFEDGDAARTARELLAGYDEVLGLDSNYYVERPPGAEMLMASSGQAFSLNPTVGGDGSTMVIGLIDTPVQKNGSPISPLLLDSVSVFGTAIDPLSASPTHGTSMANGVGQGLSSILESTGTKVRILPVDVYGASANATTFDVAHGIVLAIQNGATIVNLSLGSEGNSKLMQTVIQNGSNKGVVFVAAAGNEPVSTPFYPAAYPEVLAATAGDRRGNIASYANYGDFVDVVAPGANVVQYNNRSWFVSGTSTSSAYVSGLVAGVASQTGVSVSEAVQRVRSVMALPPARK
jgi:hypothetical protein